MPRPGGGRAVGVILSAGWAWCGFAFFLRHWAQFDFMAPVYAGAFLIEAALLLFLLVWCGRSFRPPADAVAIGGLCLAAFALFGLPLVSGDRKRTRLNSSH